MITVSVFLFISFNHQVQSPGLSEQSFSHPVMCLLAEILMQPPWGRYFSSPYQKYLFIITVLNKNEKVTTMNTVMGIVLFSRSCRSPSVNCRSSLRSALLTLCENIIFLAGRKRRAARPMDEIQYQILIASMPKMPPFSTPCRAHKKTRGGVPPPLNSLGTTF